jgi:hypothetical protein
MEKGIPLDNTDMYIIAALSQNGPGFDVGDIQDIMKFSKGQYLTSDGKINWKDYFDTRQERWNDKISETRWLNPGDWGTLWNNFRSGGNDFNTKFQLLKFYESTEVLENKGYYLPADLDKKKIIALTDKKPSVLSQVLQVPPKVVKGISTVVSNLSINLNNARNMVKESIKTIPQKVPTVSTNLQKAGNQIKNVIKSVSQNISNTLSNLLPKVNKPISPTPTPAPKPVPIPVPKAPSPATQVKKTVANAVKTTTQKVVSTVKSLATSVSKLLKKF